MKKGFTLIEMIAVIAIIGLLMITVIPSILNQLGNKKEEISGVNKTAIFTATDNYLDLNQTTYPASYGKVYCITLETLVKAGQLKSPIKDFVSGNEIALNNVVKVQFNTYDDPEYSIGDSSSCTSSDSDNNNLIYARDLRYSVEQSDCKEAQCAIDELYEILK